MTDSEKNWFDAIADPGLYDSGFYGCLSLKFKHFPEKKKNVKKPKSKMNRKINIQKIIL